MSDDSNSGVIRLQIVNVSELPEPFDDISFGTNSFVFDAKKTIIDDEEHLGIRLVCNRDMFSNVWSCNASVQISLVNFGDPDKKENSTFSMDFNKKFTRFDDEINIATFKKWDEFVNPKNFFVVGDTAVIEAKITVISCTGWNKLILETFDTPDDHLTDVCLVVEGKKCHVGKQILAQHSNYFKALFYSDFVEKSAEEIKIEGVVHSEFVDLLNCVYPTDFEINDNNVAHILKLADLFEMWFVTDNAERFLICKSSMHTVDLLKYSEVYKLGRLQDECCQRLENTEGIIELTHHERYKELGDVTLSLLFQKVAEFANNK